MNTAWIIMHMLENSRDVLSSGIAVNSWVIQKLNIRKGTAHSVNLLVPPKSSTQDYK